MTQLKHIYVSLTPKFRAQLIINQNKVLGVVMAVPRRKARVLYRRVSNRIRPQLYAYYTTTEFKKLYPDLYHELEVLAHELQLQL